MTADLFRVGGTGKDHHRTFALQLLLDDLREAQGAILFNALRHRNHDSARIDEPTQLMGRFPHGIGGSSHYYRSTALHRAQIGSKLHLLRERNPLEHGVLPSLLQCHRLSGGVGPEGNVVTVFHQKQGQSRSPAAAAYHGNLHVCSFSFSF